ncbi:MAG: M3 family oligoendopeptidase [Deltaproteobacteria bacterium]|jgi:oligoendopeptidase F|nr:M3 family oligoendopeptidase [Deltaproteobacteria bacterium]
MAADLPHWDLGQFYPAGPASLEEDLAKFEALVEKFAGRRELFPPTGEIGETVSAEVFLTVLDEMTEIVLLESKLAEYASLRAAQDVSDQRAQALEARVERLGAQTNKTLFFMLWWKRLPDELAGPLMDAAPGYRRMLTVARSFRRHTLSEAEEKIVNIKDISGGSFLARIYDSITNDFRFRKPPGAGDGKPGGAEGASGEPELLNREQLAFYFRSPVPAVRRGAYRELMRVYGENGPHLAQFYQALATDWYYEECFLRGHASPRSSRNKRNELSDETVGSLLRVCRQRGPEVFGRFFRLKAKRLGLKKLDRCDIYAPLGGESRSYSYAEGTALVDRAFRGFDGEFADLAARVAREGRLTAAFSPAKRSGAFCSSGRPGETPWVLMTYLGDQRDVFTLAHELGHAVHSQLARRHNVYDFHASLPLAETASTFGEMLLSRALLDAAPGEEARDELRFGLLDDAYATVGRQAFFSVFEAEAHEMILGGATADELSEAYLRNLREQFGDSVDVGGEFRWEWAGIPHFFHSPFYVYAYSFGQLLVYNLWRRYEEEGGSFVPRLKSILARGGSESPEVILGEAGFGPLDDDFWSYGFDVIDGLAGGE